MDLKNKYLKYKSKYLELKNKLGGTGTTFYIYTTGIADWGNLSTILKYWHEFLCKKICDQIPQRFNSIEIIHSDILEGLESQVARNRTIEQIKSLVFLDFSSDNRISLVNFEPTPLDFDLVKTKIPYIIIDFAHIFTYGLTPIPPKLLPYGSTDTILGSSHNNLNVIYLGYIGEDRINPETRINQRYLSMFRFFIVQPDNTIQTYFTRLSNSDRFGILKSEELNDPTEKISNIVKNIKRDLSAIFKNHYDNYIKFDEIFDSDNIPLYIDIIQTIMDQIMYTENNEEHIHTYIVNKIKKRYIG